MTTTTAEREALKGEVSSPARLPVRVGVRTRILGWYVALLVLVAIAELLLQRRVLLERLDEEVETGLVQESQELRTLADGRDPMTAQPFAGDVAAIFDTFLRRNIPHEGEALVTFVDGQVYKSTAAPYQLATEQNLVQKWTGLQTTDRGDIDTPAGPVRYIAIPLQHEGTTKGVFVVANFMAHERDEIGETIRVGAIVWGSVLIVASAVAWVVAGRVLAPVRVLSDTARLISETDLSRRIPVHGSDEISDLSRVFNGMLDRLEHGFVTQRSFLDDAGHELRTPITVIRGHLELMSGDPQERRETVAIVTDELDRMTRIVDDLILLARAEQPDFLRPAPVDLDILTAEIFAKVKTLGDRRWQIQETGHGIVLVDRQRLTQVLMNLADNAVHQTESGGSIVLGSRLSDGEVRMWVEDSGPGIPHHQRERIFERFARLESSRRSPGTAGLGLAIVQVIVKAHGGRIEVESEPGQGSTFTVIIQQETGGL